MSRAPAAAPSRTLVLLLRKELLFQRRTHRLAALVLLGTGLTLASLALEYGMPALLRLVSDKLPREVDLGPLLAAITREPTLVGAAGTYFGLLPLLVGGVLVAGVGGVAAEVRSGQLATLLVRPLPRYQVLLAKWVATTCSGWAGLLASGALFYLLAVVALEPPRLGPLAAALLALALLVAVSAAAAVMASAVAGGVSLAAGVAAGLVLAHGLLDLLPGVGGLLPGGSYRLALSLALGEPGGATPTGVALCGVGWAALFLVIAGWGLRRVEV